MHFAIPRRVESELVAVDDERLRTPRDVVIGDALAKLLESVEQTHGMEDAIP